MSKRAGKYRRRAGFSLGEVMVAMLILALLGAMVASGIPLAVRAYDKVVNTANAETLLSTTVMRLQDELGGTDSVYVKIAEGSTVKTLLRYKSSNIERWCSIDNEIAKTSDEYYKKGIYITQYASIVLTEGESGTEATQKRLLISTKAATDNLYTTFDGITYADGIFTVSGLKVKNRDDNDAVLASVDSLKIEALNDVSELQP